MLITTAKQAHAYVHNEGRPVHIDILHYWSNHSRDDYCERVEPEGCHNNSITITIYNSSSNTTTYLYTRADPYKYRYQ